MIIHNLKKMEITKTVDDLLVFLFGSARSQVAPYLGYCLRWKLVRQCDRDRRGDRLSLSAGRWRARQKSN